jgi:hypothetical protein
VGTHFPRLAEHPALALLVQLRRVVGYAGHLLSAHSETVFGDPMLPVA